MFKLKPFVASALWGGTRLVEEYGISPGKSNAAEAWVLSCNPNGESVVAGGPLAGRGFGEVYQQNPGICGTNGAGLAEFPLLVKLIDARGDLSIQVHPTEDYARRVEGGPGKTECWYILDASPGASLILGFKERLTRAQLERAIAENTVEALLQKVPVKRGDFFFIPAGTVHAICRGVLLAEVQQNAATTYRLYDYGRLQSDGRPRELHVEKALAVAVLDRYGPPAETREWQGVALCTQGFALLVSCEWFTVGRVRVAGKAVGTADASSMVSLLVLEGTGSVACGGERLTLKKGESLFLPAGSGDYTLRGTLDLLETRL